MVKPKHNDASILVAEIHCNRRNLFCKIFINVCKSRHFNMGKKLYSNKQYVLISFLSVINLNSFLPSSEV